MEKIKIDIGNNYLLLYSDYEAGSLGLPPHRYDDPTSTEANKVLLACGGGIPVALQNAHLEDKRIYQSTVAKMHSLKVLTNQKTNNIEIGFGLDEVSTCGKLVLDKEMAKTLYEDLKKELKKD